jgi:hypothetical protein
MSPDPLSDAEFVRRTSQVVAARCRLEPMDAAQLPSLIASVAMCLRAREPGVEQEISPPNLRSGSKAHRRAVDKADVPPRPSPRLLGTNVVYLSAFVRQRIGAAKPRS